MAVRCQGDGNFKGYGDVKGEEGSSENRRLRRDMACFFDYLEIRDG